MWHEYFPPQGKRRRPGQQQGPRAQAPRSCTPHHIRRGRLGCHGNFLLQASVRPMVVSYWGLTSEHCRPAQGSPWWAASGAAASRSQEQQAPWRLPGRKPLSSGSYRFRSYSPVVPPMQSGGCEGLLPRAFPVRASWAVACRDSMGPSSPRHCRILVTGGITRPDA